MAWSITNPYTYDTNITLRRAAFVTAHLELEQWATDVIRYSLGDLVFAKSIGMTQSVERFFGVGGGGTVTIPIYNWETDANVVSAKTPLVIGSSITLGTQVIDSVRIDLKFYGMGYSKHDEIDYITNLNNRRLIQQTMSNKAARVINALHKDIYEASQMGIYTISTAGSLSQDGQIGTNPSWGGTGGDFTLGLVHAARDGLIRSNVMAGQRGLYEIIGHPDTFRTIKNFAKFENRELYNNNGRGNLFQVLGEWEGCTWIETTERMSKGTSFIVGRNVGGYGFGQQPKVFYYPDFGEDAGRHQVWKLKFALAQGATLRDKGTTCLTLRTSPTALTYQY